MLKVKRLASEANWGRRKWVKNGSHHGENIKMFIKNENICRPIRLTCHKSRRDWKMRQNAKKFVNTKREIYWTLIQFKLSRVFNGAEVTSSFINISIHIRFWDFSKNFQTSTLRPKKLLLRNVQLNLTLAAHKSTLYSFSVCWVLGRANDNDENGIVTVHCSRRQIF